MQSVTRDEDTVSRQGGDEFAILVARPATAAGVDKVARKIRAALGRPVVIAGVSLTPKASIGVAVYPRAGRSAEAMIAAADDSMYREKQRRKHGPATGPD